MGAWRFTVPGHPVGYYASGARPNWTRQHDYHEYKQRVQRCALAAGLSLPLVANRHCPLTIHVVPYFACGVHSDPGNVQKGVVDALFYVDRRRRGRGTADKHTGGSYTPPRYDAENPRAEITIDQWSADEHHNASARRVGRS